MTRADPSSDRVRSVFGEPQDTDAEQRRRYFEKLAGMTPQERARVIARASARMRSVVLAGLRHFHPAADEQELRVRLAVRLYGRDAAARMFGTVPLDAT